MDVYFVYLENHLTAVDADPGVSGDVVEADLDDGFFVVCLAVTGDVIFQGYFFENH